MIPLDINLITLSEKQQIVSDFGKIISLISLETSVFDIHKHERISYMRVPSGL